LKQVGALFYRYSINSCFLFEVLIACFMFGYFLRMYFLDYFLSFLCYVSGCFPMLFPFCFVSLRANLRRP